MKVIITDDESDIRTLVKVILSKKGIEVIGDSSGDLVANLYHDLPDLIILDINLTDRDGGDICTKLKNDLHTRNIPIILISAIMDLRLISQFCGADDYLIKPFTVSDLEQKVTRLLKQAA
jgi:two-component system phosphate regulon response regulator PhoB